MDDKNSENIVELRKSSSIEGVNNNNDHDNDDNHVDHRKDNDLAEGDGVDGDNFGNGGDGNNGEHIKIQSIEEEIDNRKLNKMNEKHSSNKEEEEEENQKDVDENNDEKEKLNYNKSINNKNETEMKFNNDDEDQDKTSINVNKSKLKRRQMTLPLDILPRTEQQNVGTGSALLRTSHSIELSGSEYGSSSSASAGGNGRGVRGCSTSSSGVGGGSGSIPPTITTIIEPFDDIIIMRKSTFKTKRFFESEDDSLWMTHVFSETIRSTSATPTDDSEISDIVGIVELNNSNQAGTTTITTTTTANNSINNFNSVTTVNASIMNNKNMANQSITSLEEDYENASTPIVSTSFKIGASGGGSIGSFSSTGSSFQYQQQQQQPQLDPYHHLHDNDNHSLAEHSSAESQTDNIDMYNEPNLQSLIDNVTDEHISINYITDNDILPADDNSIISPRSTSSLMGGGGGGGEGSSTTIATATTTTTATTNLPSTPADGVGEGGVRREIGKRGGRVLISTPSIVVECYNDDLVKTEEYELECAHDHYSPPILKQIPRRPLDGISFFDTTIEEEEYYDADVESEGYGIGGAGGGSTGGYGSSSGIGDDDGADGGSDIIIFEDNDPINDDNITNYVSNKGTNTELPFDCKNIKSVQEAANLPVETIALQKNNIIGNDDDDEKDSLKSIRINNLELDQKFIGGFKISIDSSDENYGTAQSGGEAEDIERKCNDNNDDDDDDDDNGNNMNNDDKNEKQDLENIEDDNELTNMHASATSMQHHVENQQQSSRTSSAITAKKVTTKKFVSSTTRTSSITTSTALEAFDKATLDNNISSMATIAAIDSKLDKSQISTKIKSDNNNLAATTTTTTSSIEKKKSKKSKKSDHEKENISMKKIYLMAQPPVNWRPIEQPNRIVTINRSVSVKHLCRSFADLTQIEENKNNDDINLKRAKSVGDVWRSELNRPIQTGISVKSLRDSYCNLIGLVVGTSDNNNNNNNNSVENGANYYYYKSKKSSFNKFDALQKNILRVRSSDAGKAQEKFSDANTELNKNCRSCGKVVYKMEEIKAEKNIWHRNCFRCKECNKQLNVDTYQSHESLLYCKPHFKLLLAPKVVEDNEPLKPRKPELIIRENQPVELPPDVVRASDKPDLGLEELQQLNVKSRFQVFENYQEQQNEQKMAQAALDRSPSGVKRSSSILSKLAKFQAKGMNTGVSDDALNDVPYEQSSSEDEDDDNIPEGADADLIRAKRAQRERPISFSNMNDIKTKFEKGHIMTKEERREECKQEIQNIRSRLFMGKQARIKEMYQQAVAESEQGITSTSKKPEIEIGDKAKTLKEKFEKGEIFNREDGETESTNNKVQEDEMAVFEQGISKKSRSIFMELDASASKTNQNLTPVPTTPRTPDAKKQNQVSPLQMDKLKDGRLKLRKTHLHEEFSYLQPFTGENVIKYDEKPDDIKIETSEISAKFKFFETYKPEESKKMKFRITPPREGVVKMPSTDDDNDDNDGNDNIYIDPHVVRSDKKNDDPTVAEESHTATKMLSVFRQMESNKFHHNENDFGPKPLKRFTPPPDDNRRVYTNNDSEEESSGSEEDGEEEELGEEEESDHDNHRSVRYDDEFLKQAQSAARAKQLRAKFEKWEANEIRNEITNGSINIYDQVENNDEGQIETAKSLRAKFELMKDSPDSVAKPRIQPNRFV